MADIKIENLNISGSELFLDSESFLSELDNDELNVLGGLMAESGVSSESYHDCGENGKSTHSYDHCFW
jgi:hypothetical protein